MKRFGIVTITTLVFNLCATNATTDTHNLCQTIEYMHTVTQSLFATYLSLEELAKIYDIQFGLSHSTLQAFKTNQQLFTWKTHAEMFLIFPNQSMNTYNNLKLFTTFGEILTSLINDKLDINSYHEWGQHFGVDTLHIEAHEQRGAGFVQLYIIQQDENMDKNILNSDSHLTNLINWKDVTLYTPTDRKFYDIYDTWVTIPSNPDILLNSYQTLDTTRNIFEYTEKCGEIDTNVIKSWMDEIKSKFTAKQESTITNENIFYSLHRIIKISLIFIVVLTVLFFYYLKRLKKEIIITPNHGYIKIQPV